jgi:hypothetical protein
MPFLENGTLYNVGFLCKEMELQRCMLKFTLLKRSATLGMTGGSQIKTFDTDCGKIGIHDLL